MELVYLKVAYIYNMVSIDYIKDKILQSIQCEVCEVQDQSDTAAKYQVLIVSESFQSKSLIQRHREVYSLFAEELQGPIHALSLSTLTPSQYNLKH